jgi:hypothetical protein
MRDWIAWCNWSITAFGVPAVPLKGTSINCSARGKVSELIMPMSFV